MRRIAVLAAGVALLAAAPAAPAAEPPTGLRAFLLRVDEPRSTSFSRTPSFAWSPVRGAVRYEFQLSTSSAFRESGIVYSETSLTTPVAAPDLTLPWVTGTPYALYARVRAVTPDETTAWSAPFGFDMEAPAAPKPLPSYPGLLRWTPVDGANGYQVWFVDLPKMIYTSTNVADEREFYTFHQAASWLGQVRWRVRSLRLSYNETANKLPAVAYGPWSPVYSSVNPPFATGPLKPLATVSDVVSTGARSSPAHRLMPAFVFGGNASLSSLAAELYRVYVYTDRSCINRVYTGAIVGSPAYAPRTSGPLALPLKTAALATARTSYLSDGDEGTSYTADFEKVTANESLPDPKPTTSLPSGTQAGGGASSGGSGSGGSGAGADSKPAGVELIKAKADWGPPTDIWDTDWENGGGYYWTVMPVDAVVPASLTTSVAGSGSAIGATTIPLASTAGFGVGDVIVVGNSGNEETATITAVDASTVSVAAALLKAHGAGEPVVRASGNIQYRDRELAQDVCAAGRVMRFGKESEPALTAGGDAFASGLTPGGELASAQDTPVFYRSPIVAWTTALGAEVYAVQWSKTREPFVPAVDPATGALGKMTANTSEVLPLEPGTWWYRVRGYDYSLPEGAQAMSWSAPERLVVTAPTFQVVAADSTTRGVLAADFSLQLPAGWRSGSAGLRPLGLGSQRLRLARSDGRGSAVFVQTAAESASSSQSAWAAKAMAAARKLPGRAGAVECHPVSLMAGAAVRCSTAVRSGGRTQYSLLYQLRHRRATYSLTFASTARIGPARAAGFAAIAHSLRFTS